MIDAHRGAFEYDWRTRFHMSLRVVGRSMSWGEAVRLTAVLAADPSAQVSVALAGWERPYSFDELALLNIFDSSEAGRVGKRFKPMPRPWDRRRFRGASLTREQLRAILDAHRR